MSEFWWVSVKLVREKEVKYLATINCPKDAVNIVRPMLEDCDREKTVALMLDTKNHVVAANVVSVGVINASLIHPREVFKVALLCNASRVVIAHNHPSGDPTPSSEDMIITENLAKAGEILGVEVLDHIIIGNKAWLSMKERGAL